MTIRCQLTLLFDSFEELRGCVDVLSGKPSGAVLSAAQDLSAQDLIEKIREMLPDFDVTVQARGEAAQAPAQAETTGAAETQDTPVKTRKTRGKAKRKPTKLKSKRVAVTDIDEDDEDQDTEDEDQNDDTEAEEIPAEEAWQRGYDLFAELYAAYEEAPAKCKAVLKRYGVAKFGLVPKDKGHELFADALALQEELEK